MNADTSSYLPQTNPTSQSVFPQEVYDSIIDHLHDEREALNTCSLVSKAWVSSSSFHLWIGLTWKECFRELLELFQRSPHIPRNLRQLTLTSARLNGDRWTSDTECVVELLPCECLLTTLDLTPRLDTLELFDVGWDKHRCPWPDATSHKRFTRKMDTVVLGHSGDMCCEDDLHWLACFSHIGSFVGRGDLKIPSRVRPQSSNIRIDNIDLLECAKVACIRMVRDFFPYMLELACVRSVTFSDILQPDVYEAFLYGIRNVEALRYALPEEPYSLSQFTCLRSLTIDDIVCDWGDGSLYTAMWWERYILSHFGNNATGRIEELGVVLYFPARSIMEDGSRSESSWPDRILLAVDWAAAIPVLRRCAPRCKLRVEIRCHVDVDVSEAAVNEAIHAAFRDVKDQYTVEVVHKVYGYEMLQEKYEHHWQLMYAL